MADTSEKLNDIAFAALDHAIASTVPTGGDLVPFALVERAGETTLTRFVAETLEGGAARARDHVRESAGADRAAIAWEGYLVVEGDRFTAVLVEAYEAGAPAGMVLAQRHRQTGLLRKTRTLVGNPALMSDSSAPLF